MTIQYLDYFAFAKFKDMIIARRANRSYKIEEEIHARSAYNNALTFRQQFLT